MPANEWNHTAFALGRGRTADVLGEFAGFLAPADLLRVPIGRRLLAATTHADVRDRFAQFAKMWELGGWDTAATPAPHTSVPDATPHPAERQPYARTQTIFAFDDGGWFVWFPDDHPQWHAILIDCHGSLTEHPVARIHGRKYPFTRGLDVGQLTAWIMADATRTLAPLGVELSARVHHDDVDASIELYIHNGLIEWEKLIITEVRAVAAGHNWANPCDPEDRRFTLTVDIAEDEVDTVPGTIHVIDRHFDD